MCACVLLALITDRVANHVRLTRFGAPQVLHGGPLIYWAALRSPALPKVPPIFVSVPMGYPANATPMFDSELAQYGVFSSSLSPPMSPMPLFIALSRIKSRLGDSCSRIYRPLFSVTFRRFFFCCAWLLAKRLLQVSWVAA